MFNQNARPFSRRRQRDSGGEWADDALAVRRRSDGRGGHRRGLRGAVGGVELWGGRCRLRGRDDQSQRREIGRGVRLRGADGADDRRE